MRARSTPSPVFSFLACALLGFSFLLGGFFGRSDGAAALEVVQYDPGEPECRDDGDCAEEEVCTAGSEHCEQDPECAGQEVCAQVCWGYCVSVERSEGFSPVGEPALDCEAVFRGCEQEENWEECVRVTNRDCIKEGFLEEEEEEREGGEDHWGCEEGAERMVQECEARIAETGMDPGLCQRGAENFFMKCSEGFGVVSEEYVEGPREDHTGDIARILSYAVQLVIQNVAEYPELKDAAQTLSRLIVTVAGGDIGSVVPEAVQVLQGVKGILGVQDYQEGPGMMGPGMMEEFTPKMMEMMQQNVGPMMGQMETTLGYVGEAMEYLAGEEVKPTVLAELEKRQGNLEQEWEELVQLYEAGNPELMDRLGDFGAKMEAMGQYADEHVPQKHLNYMDEEWFEEEEMQFGPPPPPWMMDQGMYQGMEGGYGQGMYPGMPGPGFDPTQFGGFVDECLRGPEPWNCFAEGAPGQGFGPPEGMPWMQGEGFPGEGEMPWMPGEGFQGQGDMPWRDEEPYQWSPYEHEGYEGGEYEHEPYGDPWMQQNEGTGYPPPGGWPTGQSSSPGGTGYPQPPPYYPNYPTGGSSYSAPGGMTYPPPGGYQYPPPSGTNYSAPSGPYPYYPGEYHPPEGTYDGSNYSAPSMTYPEYHPPEMYPQEGTTTSPSPQ